MKKLWHTLLVGAIGGIVIGYLMALGFSTFFNTPIYFLLIPLLSATGPRP